MLKYFLKFNVRKDGKGGISSRIGQLYFNMITKFCFVSAAHSSQDCCSVVGFLDKICDLIWSRFFKNLQSEIRVWKPLVILFSMFTLFSTIWKVTRFKTQFTTSATYSTILVKSVTLRSIGSGSTHIYFLIFVVLLISDLQIL